MLTIIRGQELLGGRKGFWYVFVDMLGLVGMAVIEWNPPHLLLPAFYWYSGRRVR